MFIEFWISGSSSGLSLILNVEQYEYMRGPQNDAGVKVNSDIVVKANNKLFSTQDLFQ